MSLRAAVLSAVTGVFLACGGALAGPISCPDHFSEGDAPDLLLDRLSERTQVVCYSGYGLLHSGVSRTPLWTGEHLTRESVAAARSLDRINRFHPDPHIPEADRAELADYRKSGFDRGHMAPSGDMPTEQAQAESFTLANMVPQHPKSNQRIWMWIESAVRDYVLSSGDVYVVTGPLFQGRTLKRLNNRVLVPTHTFKAVYDPRTKMAGVYVVENAATTDYKVVSVAELEQLSGIAVFPRLTSEARSAVLTLPAPVAR